jgi:hypothetical protein
METEARYWDEVVQKVSLIPVGQEDFFRRLWRGGRLRYKGAPLQSDSVDELSARMLVTAVRRKTSLFVLMPSSGAEQAPALFGSLLLIDAVDKILDPASRLHRVVVFGSTIGIRAHLANITVHGLSLSEVFKQVHLQQDARRVRPRNDSDGQLSDQLPEVVCSLSPVRPREVLDRFRPTWIAVDCGAGEVEWLGGVLNAAKEHDIPVVGWIAGYPSLARGVLRQYQLPVFSWPPMRRVDGRTVRMSRLSGRSLVNDSAHLNFLPVVLRGAQADSLSTQLDLARRALISLARKKGGQLFDDCLRAGWRCLRGLEALHVPMQFHDVESRQFWGMSQIGARRAAFDRFLEAIRANQSESYQRLADTARALDTAIELTSTAAPPLWTALLTLCVGEATLGSPQLVVFSSAARRKLFELALASFEGITVTDLATLGVSLSSLTELMAATISAEDPDGGLIPIRQTTTLRGTASVNLVGWPSISRIGRLASLFAFGKIRTLALPHQEPDIHRNIAALASACAVSPAEDADALRDLGLPLTSPTGTGDFAYVEAAATEYLDVTGHRRDETTLQPPHTWRVPDPIDEAEWLLREDDADLQEESTTPALDIGDDEPQETASTDQTLVVDQVIWVDLIDGRRVLFAPDSDVNVIRGGGAYESMRSIRADRLRPGDRIIFIHGQRRQSLYDLIIDRVHTHPSIRLHLALIRAWHQEIDRAYRAWSEAHGLGFDSLLERLRALGCQRTAPLTVRLWVTGEIICPSDPEDLRRVAEVLDIPFVRDHYGRISRAADRLRGLHRGLANRLSNWIRAQAAGAMPAREDDVFDEELGLSLTDFRESLEVLVVRTVTEAQGLYLRSSLNRISERGIP